jgi:hypothetical protein
MITRAIVLSFLLAPLLQPQRLPGGPPKYEVIVRSEQLKSTRYGGAFVADVEAGLESQHRGATTTVLQVQDVGLGADTSGEPMQRHKLHIESCREHRTPMQSANSLRQV